MASLWISPTPSTFGVAFAPLPTLTTSADADINSDAILSFVLLNRNAGEPANGIFDELRIGTSWASVTPPAQPPLLNYAMDGANLILSWSTNLTGFTLQASPVLTSSNSSWTAVSWPVSVVNGQYTVTNPISSGSQFFRLLAQ